MNKTELLQVIRRALWGTGEARGDREILMEMKAHAIAALPAHALKSMSLPDDLLKEWKILVYRQMVSYDAYLHAQKNLPITVPYVILKGTTAAQYYPWPELRNTGDIDIITRHEDYDTACRQVLDNGFVEITGKVDRERKRHREFAKGSTHVEIHLFFASMNDPVKAEKFEDLILKNINDSHVLPHLVNGLVLLEHINQHLQEGLGLRQIIDWMMFVDRELPDEKWPEFRKMAVDTGLEKLAVTATRMCEMELGLKEHAWCRNADEALCRDLMEYVLACGNFGTKRTEEEKTALGRAEKIRHPVKTIRELQQMGVRNWKKAKNPLLRPWAWLWQGMRVAENTTGLVEGYGEKKKLNKMLDDLEVLRIEKGLVYFEDGRYVRKPYQPQR